MSSQLWARAGTLTSDVHGLVQAWCNMAEISAQAEVKGNNTATSSSQGKERQCLLELLLIFFTAAFKVSSCALSKLALSPAVQVSGVGRCALSCATACLQDAMKTEFRSNKIPVASQTKVVSNSICYIH